MPPTRPLKLEKKKNEKKAFLVQAYWPGLCFERRESYDTRYSNDNWKAKRGELDLRDRSLAASFPNKNQEHLIARRAIKADTVRTTDSDSSTRNVTLIVIGRVPYSISSFE